MKNAQYWMEYLERLSAALEKGTTKPVQAVEMNNAAGKAISLAKLLLEYQKLKHVLGNKVVTIPMLEGSPTA
jgi:hypothetical protein